MNDTPDTDETAAAAPRPAQGAQLLEACLQLAAGIAARISAGSPGQRGALAAALVLARRCRPADGDGAADAPMARALAAQLHQFARAAEVSGDRDTARAIDAARGRMVREIYLAEGA